MRLQRIALVLEHAVPRLTYTHSTTPSNSTLKDFRDAIDAVREISETGMFAQEIARILGIEEIALHVSDAIVINNSTFNTFNNTMIELRSRGQLLLATLRANLPPEDATSVAIKLPPTADLATVAETLTELNTALQQLVLNEHVGGDVRLSSFDRGSNWIVVMLGSAAALRLLGGLLRIIMETRLKEVEVASRREMLRRMKLKTDAIAAIEEALEEEIRDFRDERLDELAEGVGIPESDHDTRARVRFALNAFTDLIGRGAEIEPSANLPSADAALFPPAHQLADIVRQLSGPKKEIEGSIE